MKTETEITLNLICVLLAFAIGFIVLRISPPSLPNSFPLPPKDVVCSLQRVGLSNAYQAAQNASQAGQVRSAQ